VQQRDLLLAVFGHRVLTIPRHGHFQRRVVTASFRHDHSRIGTVSSLAHLKRTHIWKNAGRNRRLGKLAKALVTGDSTILSTFDPEIADFMKSNGVQHICILVENLDHAYHLAKQYPVPVACAAKPNLATWSKPQQERLSKNQYRTDNPATTVIATASGLRQIPELDVLINATGTAGVPSIPDHLLYSTDDDVRLLLIDVDDMDHGILQEWSRRRRHFFQSQAIDEDDPRAALNAFLNSPVVEL
jgi:hypothetical protein